MGEPLRRCPQSGSIKSPETLLGMQDLRTRLHLRATEPESAFWQALHVIYMRIKVREVRL